MRFASVLVLGAVLAGCGPTLSVGPNGWHDDSVRYSVAPLPDGRLFTPAWKLTNYDERAHGFRNNLSSEADFAFTRTDDDGILLVYTKPIDDDDRDKLAPALVDRWLDRVAVNPRSDDDWVSEFRDIVPTLEMTTHGSVALHSSTMTTTVGHEVQILDRQTFTVPGGAAAEVVAHFGPQGGTPDRGLYLAIEKPAAAGDRDVIVVYGDALPQFDKGLDDARSFAHRIRF